MTMAPDRIMESNIGPREQRRRLTFGIVMLVVALGIVAGQIALDWPMWWRLLTALPFFAGMLGVLQAHKGT